MDGWAVGRFGPGPDVITLTSLTYVRTLEPTVALANAASIRIETRFFGNFSFARSVFRQSKNAPRCPPPQKFHKKREKRSVAKMKVQVVTINSVQKSSKSELSSGTFGHVKV